jgi:hypothetical protein
MAFGGSLESVAGVKTKRNQVRKENTSCTNYGQHALQSDTFILENISPVLTLVTLNEIEPMPAQAPLWLQQLNEAVQYVFWNLSF